MEVSGDAMAYVAGRDQTIVIHDGPSRLTRTMSNQEAGECPYPGLAAFGAGQARWFFGRDQVIADLLIRLDHRLTSGGLQLVVAPSGAGKSSLLRAGLLPRLAEGALPGSRTWPILVLTPTSDPFGALADRLRHHIGGRKEQVAAELAVPGRAVALLRRLLEPGPGSAEPAGPPVEDPRLTGPYVPDGGPAGEGRRVVVVVDQFEELFTLCPDRRQREAFIAALAALAAPGPSGEPPVALVAAGLRADFYPACAAHPELRAALQDRHLLLGAMTAQQVREAIIYPARAAGLEIEPGLVELLLRDLGVGHDPESARAREIEGPPRRETGGGPGPDQGREIDGGLRADPDDRGGYEPGRLPLLAHALRATWLQHRGAAMTVQGYRDTGTIHRAIARTADDVYTNLPPEAKEAARPLFLRLVRIGDGTQDTRRRLPRAELIEAAADPAAAATALDAFTRARMLTQDDGTVLITHEALLRGWPRLRGWLGDDRAGRLLHQDLEEAAAAWSRTGRDTALLYRGSRLDAARAWAEADPGRSRDELSPAARAFLAAAIWQRRRTQRRRTTVTAALAALALLASTAAVFAFGQQREALHQRDTAVYQRLLSEADRTADTDTALSAQLTLLADRRRPAGRPADETYTRLINTRQVPLPLALTGQRAEVNAVAYGPDGRTLASGGADGAIRLWNVEAPGRAVPRGRPLQGHAGAVADVAFSPDGKTLASTGADRTVRLWQVGDPDRPAARGAPLTGHRAFVFGLAFSPDGRTLASGDGDGVIRMWNLAAPGGPAPLGRPIAAHGGRQVTGVAFSPDGKTLASGGSDTLIRLWDVRDPRRPALRGKPLTEHSDTVAAVAFSPDGVTLASGGMDASVRLWDVRDPDRPSQRGRPLDGHTGSVLAVAFAPDGRTLASAGADQAVRVWDVTDPDLPRLRGRPLTGHADTVWGLAFSPDGTALASAGDDRSVRLWQLPSGRLAGHTGAVWTVALSPDGATLASGGKDRTVRLWNVRDPDRPAPRGRPLTGHADAVTALAFSPDGRTLASAGEDRAVRLWDVTDPGRPVLRGRPLTGHTSYLLSVAFSPDGRTLASAGEDRTIRLWDVTDPDRPAPRGGPLSEGAGVYSVAFSPDGATLAAAGEAGVVRLWDVRDPGRPVLRGRPLAGHGSVVWAVAFSPDGATLASAGNDRTVRLWDVRDPGRARAHAPVPPAHTGAAVSVAFSPDGRRLASAGADHAVRLWDVTRPGAARPAGQPLVVRGSAISRTVFGPDGLRLASASSNGDAWLWDLRPERAVRRVCALTGTSFTRQAWQRHVGADVAYDPPCR
ncbi:WD40 repeat domain-containing protein [Nonomuraea candida]|uniref:WD40 repeat domain-containing protein n=1 Tax=Nonomuraea candida TaxID=359159 RepID=UPI000693BCCE|nr:WD40 repeat domain-containing protein [Nonomuraea candida]